MVRDAAGASRRRHVPERTCLGCRGKAPRAQLVRLVVDDSGSLVVDARALMPGRGAWIHPDTACLERAERRQAFSRALRVGRPPDAAGVRQWLSVFLGATPGAGEAAGASAAWHTLGRDHSDSEGG